MPILTDPDATIYTHAVNLAEVFYWSIRRPGKPGCQSPKVRICRKHRTSQLAINIVGKMISVLVAILSAIISAINRHRDLVLENLALRQQLAVFKRRHPRPKLQPADRLFWVWLSTV
jgi:hypothetical protein